MMNFTRALAGALAMWSFCAGGGAAADGLRPPQLVDIPAGTFIAGSDTAEREAAYTLDEAAYGHSVTRQQGWYDTERRRAPRETGAFSIMTTPVTNAQYAVFLAAVNHRPPDIDRQGWMAQGLIHDYELTRRHAWPGESPPPGRENHPVVLVNLADAKAYARWLSRTTGRRWRLPTELEWEKAARGVDGRRFPWGDLFDPARLNSHDTGPFDTTAVGNYANGASPFGMLDAAGQVFEWTASEGNRGRNIVKGGSWDDRGCGVCRPAARHARPASLRHILIGFRLVRD